MLFTYTTKAFKGPGGYELYAWQKCEGTFVILKKEATLDLIKFKINGVCKYASFTSWKKD